MKTIIIEGMDNTGKNTIIQKLMEKYSVVKIIHSGKPKSKTNEEAYDLLKGFGMPFKK